MSVSQRLEVRQSQSLVMTPQLQQAIKLLQLSNLELSDYVASEIEQNPLLRADERGPASEEGDWRERSAPDQSERSADPQGPAEAPDSAATAASDVLTGERDAPLDAETTYDDLGPADGAAGPLGDTAGLTRSRGGETGEFTDFEQRLGQAESLRDRLVAQLQLSLTEDGDRLIGLTLIDSLTESGYLGISLAEAAAQLSVAESEVERVLRVLQGFEPTGLFARTLRECLALQLAERDRLDPLMSRLLEHLEMIADGETAKLRKLLGCDAEDFTDMMAEIRSLDPRPGSGLDSGPAEAVVPDVLMRALPGGAWSLELNPDTLPRVLVDRAYYTRVAGSCRRKQDKDYLSEQLQSANWLVKALHQRATTIIKVAAELVRQQDGFFRHGVSHLKPLILRDVAEAIELHESTVSRVTANKFIATPRGTFELKYFFTTAVSGANGTEVSAESVRHRIRAMIEDESPKKILSDDTIVDHLRGEGIDIARRTVAKYRESMRIPSSVQRRRQKAMMAF
ncbi:RNA polymerase factor sigma-54 [Algihabitans albus]|uniref:RNA polymerase factor sigma-54 n=1 Tax=Algihabitans albus TaxID=2164067 RepID=UPI000E5CF68D|nr:RNA polymerase factor sigma-54 [Algihabitans albus]